MSWQVGSHAMPLWLVGLFWVVAMMVGIGLGATLVDILELKEIFGDGVFARERQPFTLLPIFAVVAGAVPAGALRLGVFLASVAIVTAWVQVAGPAAVWTSELVWPERQYFISYSAFALLAIPVTALCLTVMKQAGAPASHGAQACVPHWLVLSLPGLALTGLFLDFMGGAWFIGGKPDPEDWQLGFPVFTAGVVCFWGTRPGPAGHWAILVCVAGLAMIVGVSLQSALFGYGDANLLRAIPKLTVIPAVLLGQYLVVRAAKAITGPKGPWGAQPIPADRETEAWRHRHGIRAQARR